MQQFVTTKQGRTIFQNIVRVSTLYYYCPFREQDVSMVDTRRIRFGVNLKERPSRRGFSSGIYNMRYLPPSCNCSVASLVNANSESVSVASEQFPDVPLVSVFSKAPGCWYVWLGLLCLLW